MRLKGFIGPAYTLSSRNIEAQQCINLYPQNIETGTGKEGEIAALISTPGMRNILEVGTGPIRCIHVDPRGTLLVVSGTKLYKVEFSGATWSATELGSLNTSSGTVRAASNKLANGDSITVFVDGTDSYTYEYIVSPASEDFDDYAGRSYSQVDGATHVVFIDGYFIFNKPDTGLFYVSEWGTFNVDPLSFASAEGDPDNIVALISNHRELWLVGQRTSEVFTNTGNADFPFERVQGGFIEKGTAAPHSVAEIDGVIFWLGRDKSGQGIIYAAQGLNPQRISTHAIENEIQSYEIDSINTADAYTYHDGGHSFYVLNFPENTWVYDLNTKLWHERSYNEGGDFERHRAEHHAFVPQYGIHVLGDYEDNRLYQFDNDFGYDDETAILRRRSSPHVASEIDRVFHDQAQLDMETGVGIDGGVQGSDPQVMMDFSDDGGHNWSNEKWASAGAIGEYKKRAIWRRLGWSRDRIYRVTISDPIKVNLLGMELKLTKGAH